MKKSLLVVMLMTISTLRAQDTTCGIVWYPPIQLSPGITAVDEMNPSIAVQGDTVHVTWAWSSQKFPYRRSVNGGQTFEPIRELAPDTVGEIGGSFVTAKGHALFGMFATNETATGGGDSYLMISTDRGNSWSMSDTRLDAVGWVTFTSCEDTLVLIDGYDQGRHIFYTTDLGTTWVRRPSPIIQADPRIALNRGVLHKVVGFAFDSSGVWSEYVVQYRKSTDLGDTWSDSVNLSSMNTAALEPAIAADGSGDSATVLTAWKDAKYGCLTLVGCGILGRRSGNSGGTFEPEQRFDDRPAGVVATTAARGSTLAVGWGDDMEDGGIRLTVSLDYGSTWCTPFNVRTHGDIRGIALSHKAIHVVYSELIGGSRGRWRVFYRRGVMIETSVSDQPGGTLPPFVTLDQNYPNPFNPTTVIRYQLPTAGVVLLRVYDVLGREVQTLVSERRDAGTHEAVWDASGVPSGVYYYRLTLAGPRGTVFTQTKKMIIIH